MEARLKLLESRDEEFAQDIADFKQRLGEYDEYWQNIVTPGASKPTTDRLDRRRLLHHMMLQAFDGSELKDLYFDLGTDYDAISGENKSDKVRELILFCIRESRTEDLLKICQKKRPKLTWPLSLD